MTGLKFGLNRMVAPAMGLPEFLDLAASVDAVGIELRNDLPGFDVIDAMDASEVRDRLAERGLRVLTINAVQHFNLPSAVDDATTELRRLIGYAKELGNPAIVMCPHCDTGDDRSPGEMARDTETALRHYRPILEDAGVVGLVEPLGFPESSLRDATVAAEIIGEIGSGAYRITLDTFHFAVAEIDPALLGSGQIPADMIGIVHISGVTAAGAVTAFRDHDRVYVDANDRVGNIESVKRLLAAGYSGPASFEPFSPSVHGVNPRDMVRIIKASIAYIQRSTRTDDRK